MFENTYIGFKNIVFLYMAYLKLVFQNLQHTVAGFFDYM